MHILDLKQNYFALFGLEIDFDINLNLLHASQQKLLSTVHPDRFVSGSDLDKRVSVQQSSWINEAYQTLIDPVKRARYMLQISGQTFNDDSETTSDTTFLMEQIGIREQIDDCRTSSDPLASCAAIIEMLNIRSKELSMGFVQHYKTGQLETARHESRKMQFIQRVLEQAKELEFELEEELG